MRIAERSVEGGCGFLLEIISLGRETVRAGKSGSLFPLSLWERTDMLPINSTQLYPNHEVCVQQLVFEIGDIIFGKKFPS